MGSKSIESENEQFEVVEENKETGNFIVKHHPMGNILTIVNTFAEMFPQSGDTPANSFFLFWVCL
jgi:hypothetical protein